MSEILNFLNKVLPNEGYRCWFAAKKGERPQQRFCETNEELARILLAVDSRKWDAYFACSTFRTKETRGGDNVLGTKSFWLDIDAGPKKNYTDADAAEQALMEFCDSVGLPHPTIICSGNGIHAYWVIDRTLTPKEWLPIAATLKALTQEKGLHADASVTSDISRILRPPQTLNWKNPSEPKEVFIISDADPIPLDSFVSKIQKTKPTADLNSALGQAIIGGIEQRTYEPSSGLLVSNHCAQLRLLRDTKGNVDEPLWYACLGVLAHCTDGETLAHEWSEGYAGYSERETQAKFEHAKNAAGPTTCAKFRSLNPGGCAGCPHMKTSPIQLGVSEAIVTPPYIGDEADKLPSLPVGYKFGANMEMLASLPNPDYEEGAPGANGEKFKWVVISNNPFYISSVREQETNERAGKRSLKLMRRTPHEVWKGFTIQDKELFGSHWQASLSEFGVRCVPGFEKNFKKLLEGMISLKEKSGRLDMSYTSFGWKDNRQGFVCGRKYYSRTGVKNVSGTAEFETVADGLIPNSKGSLAKWRSTAMKLFAPGCEAQAFTMLCSFAAPLMDLLFADDEGGAMVSLVSSGSGQGKTAAILAAETVWGLSKCLRVTEAASVAAKFRALGVRCHLPVVIDEWADTDVPTIAKIVKQFTGGTDKERLTMSGEHTRERLNFKTVWIGTTNFPVVGPLRQEHYSAQAARIFEIGVSIPKHIEQNQTADLNQTLQENAGYAGPVFLMHLLNNYDLEEIRRQVNALANYYGKILKGNTEIRFKTRLAAAVTIVSKILSKPQADGEAFLDHSTKTIVKFMLGQIKDYMQENGGRVSAIEHLNQFIRDNMADFLIVQDAYNASKPYLDLDISLPRGKLVGRYERISHRLFVPNVTIKKLAFSVKIPYAEFSKELENLGVVLNRNRRTSLCAGVERLTPVTAPCWEIDLSHEGLAQAEYAVKTSDANAISGKIVKKRRTTWRY
ncbi:MAG: DUF927 domain-containing protein [Patescibacteria group bacterium]|nr:DUF927 domain-containing protein [Patescibacteria group bacterium]